MKRVWTCLALMAVVGGCRGSRASPAPAASVGPTPRSDVSVTEISLGRAVDADRRVAQPLEGFAPGDTVYASIVTQGSGPSGRLKARWTYGGSELVAESSLDIAPSGTTVSEFHISKPNGLPAGHYEVEIFLDGASAGKRSFSVQ